eukprot:TRINITY_DN36906_c0_g1_i1.p1 TRINITY_DN36906_c0_g1~~TRINITY_DN36906_c0_g1_i1.p1  ORF type:complete len:675 (-),score=124.35 TRINITY_DN36906_c0_g1_i1:55-2037(-)
MGTSVETSRPSQGSSSEGLRRRRGESEESSRISNGRCLIAAAVKAAEVAAGKPVSTAAEPFENIRRRFLSAYELLRWPLFIIASLLLFVILVLYFAIRALIHGSEWLFAPSVTRRARKSMLLAASFEDYHAAACALDAANNLEAWKARPTSRYYAWQILASALVELVEARQAGDWRRLLRALQRSLREVNFAGHLTEAIYAKTFTGTKHLIEDYNEAVLGAFADLRELVESHESAGARDKKLLAEARHFTEFAVCTFGHSALCLSGGGAMAFQHFGVLDELLRRGLLPKIISGTSGGAAVASYVCCRTDEELLGREQREDLKGYPLKLEPDEIQPSLTLWAGSWCQNMQHYFRHGCLFEREPIERWAELWALGSTTFLEAYLRTGRVLNITCSILESNGGDQVPLLLNYHSHPHVLISSAVICSGSMPSLLNPSQLLEKCPTTGIIRSHCKRETCYADGSIDFDIPSLSLAQAFGVRYTIAVQVNPHVTPFNFPPHGEAGRPISWSTPSGKGRWRGGFVLCALELILKESFRTIWKIMGLLKLLPRVFGAKWDLFFAQVYDGSVTLSTDRGYLWKAVHSLSNPSKEDLRYWWREGQVMAWQKMPLLEKRLHTEQALSRLDQALEGMCSSGGFHLGESSPRVRRRLSSFQSDSRKGLTSPS